MPAKKKAGRPAKPPGEKYVNISLTLPPDVAAKMQRLGGSAAKAIDKRAIRRGVVIAATNAT